MIGAICTRDILRHPMVTVRCFGWRTLLRVLLNGKGKTFLALLSDNGTICPADPEATAILRRCVDLELRAENIYLTLAEATADEPTVSMFFATLAEQEQDHAELLRLCVAASDRAGWKMEILLAWRDSVVELDKEMSEAEKSVSALDTLDDALRLTIQLELSEVNRIFLAAMSASNSDFIKKLRPFQDAVETHINYITDEIMRLAPHLAFDREALEEEAQEPVLTP
jgi:hypothetical protein